MPPPRPLPALLAGLCLLLTPWAQAERLVVVRSTADRDYVARRTQDGKRLVQSYVFLPGRYFEGLTYDPILTRTKFEEIARVLAADLRRQDFVPARALAEADLVLVVHWGVTEKVHSGRDLALTNLDALRETSEQIGESFTRESAAVAGLSENAVDGQMALLGSEAGIRTDLEAQAAHQTAALREVNTATGPGRDNAQLLGFSRALSAGSKDLFLSEEMRALDEMTREERYFIIVMALDARELLKRGATKRLWTARASIRSAGVNFTQAVERISQITGAYFGTQQEDVKFDRVGDRQTKIELGEIVVLSTSEAAPKSPVNAPAKR